LYIEKLLKELIGEFRNAGDENIGWKEAALSWKYLYEIAINDSIEGILKSWESYDFVYLIQDRSIESGETKIICIVDKNEGGKRITGRGNNLIAAIKDANNQIIK